MKYVFILILCFALGGCGASGSSGDDSDTYCDECTTGIQCTDNCGQNPTLQGSCSANEACKVATDGKRYCFQYTDNGSIDGTCP